MKKLMTLLSAATVALGLYAYNDTGTSFEGASEGAFLLNTADDLPIGALGNHTDLWATNGVLALNVISNETACPHHDAYANVPDQFKSEQNSKYLSIKSTFGNTLTRYINTNGSTESIGNGLYFDSMVKFTSFDQDPTNIAAIATEFAGAKIAVWVQTTEDESATNLYVWAGQFYGDQGETRGVAYKCKNIGDVDAWHRLTIKAIGTIYPGVDQMAPAFVVYVDGEAVGRQNDAEDTGIELSKLGNAYIDLFSNKKSIYPSLQQGTVGTSLASATFDGQGEIDDVVFTATAPDFAKDKDYGEVNWDIADFASVKVDGTEYLNDGKYLTDLTGGYSNVTFNVEYAYGKSGPATQSFTFEPGAMGPFTLTASDAAAVVVVGNVTNSCVDATAIANALKTGVTGDDQAVVTLIDDVGELLSLDGVAGRVKIDLNGKSVASIEAPNGVWIYDSTYTGNNDAAVGRVLGYSDLSGNDTPSVIEAGWFDDAVMFGSDSVISNGFFAAGENKNTKAALDPFAKGGYEFTEAAVGTLYEGYLILTEQQQGTVFTVTLTWGANETPVLYQINEDTSVDISGETSPFVISDVGSGTNVSFIVANADGAKKGYAVTVAGADAAIDATGATFGWPEYLGEAVSGAYQIDDANDLDMLRKGVAAGLTTAGETFKQTDNIDMASAGAFAGIGTYNTAGGGNPATGGVSFCGTYDGQGYKISNVTFTDRDYAGIFNQVNGGTVQNLTVENLTFVGTGSKYCASIIGNAGNGATLRNLVSAGSFGSAEKPGNHNMAGIAIRLSAGGTGTLVQNCTNNAAIYGTYTKLAGICALTQTKVTGGAVTFDGCVNNGTLTMPSGSTAGRDGLAGIVGYASDATVLVNCSNTGAISSTLSTAKIGELVGYVYADYTLTDQGGNSGDATKKLVCEQAGTINGFKYATVDNGVATTVTTLAAGNTYLLEGNAAPTFEFTAAGSIAFDTALGYTLDDAGIAIASDIVGLTLSSNTVGTVTTYTAAGGSGTPVHPGEVAGAYDSAEAATNACATALNDLAAAQVVANALGQETANYLTNFTAKVVANASTGKYDVVIDLKPAVEEFLQDEADADAAEFIEDISSAAITIDTMPGFYYTLVYGPTIGSMVEKSCTLATGGTLELNRPTTPGATAGFYKVLVTIEPILIEQN